MITYLIWEVKFIFCLKANRIWASTPQIADYTDYADCKRLSVRSGCYLSELGFKRLPIQDRSEMF